MFAVILLCLATSALSQQFYGPNWQDLSNSAKTNTLNTVIKNDTTPGTFPSPLQLPELFIESMQTTFDYVGDDMPAQWLGRRHKLIHSVGVIMDAKWVPKSNTYTGVFQGCDNLYVRLSLAKPPLTSPKGYAPGLSMKCMRSGAPSANLFAMYSLQGQDSWNFFAHDLTNHVPQISSSSADFALQQLVKTFSKASDFPVMIGLNGLASIDQRGVNISSPKFPFRLIFHPTTAIHGAFPDSPQQPFQNVLLHGLSKPGPLYEVYAQNEPSDAPSAYLHIGTLVTTSPATTSNFGDVYMFFQHTRMEGDFVYRPEWKQAAVDIMKLQSQTPYYTFPDLPFN